MLSRESMDRVSGDLPRSTCIQGLIVGPHVIGPSGTALGEMRLTTLLARWFRMPLHLSHARPV